MMRFSFSASTRKGGQALPPDRGRWEQLCQIGANPKVDEVSKLWTAKRIESSGSQLCLEYWCVTPSCYSNSPTGFNFPQSLEGQPWPAQTTHPGSFFRSHKDLKPPPGNADPQVHRLTPPVTSLQVARFLEQFLPLGPKLLQLLW